MISDERLAETIDELEPFNNLVQVVDGGDIKEFLIELQQLRAEKHERRWRKIDGQIKLPVPFQLTDGEQIFSFDKWADEADGAEEMYLDDIGMNATHWRPQLTDLPEGE